ncbi:hypothetical protein [Amycolatopsis thailandensis]|uniref:hypothetical protein n=1 Tax=Amycolatopsis thailandensis TaxID=589330 RepID=UPI00362A01CE
MAPRPPSRTESERVKDAAGRLAELLLGYQPYRAIWQRHPEAFQHKGAGIHQRAVCHVLSDHLWSRDSQVREARSLKDVVSRALSGTVLSAKTLELFIAAFHMTDLHADQLRALRSGDDPSRIAIVRPSPDDHDNRTRPRYQTVALHEHHVINEHGLPSHHRTMQIIRAQDEISSYRYRFDTSAAAIDVHRGGTAGEIYSTSEAGVYAVDITFDRPRKPGETVSLEYSTTLRYPTPPPPEFRRASRRRVENVEIHVQFSTRRLPDQVWWAVWDHLDDSRPISLEPLPVEPDGTVHRYLDTLEGIVGFQWTFPHPSN